jgi:hypothetical protein
MTRAVRLVMCLAVSSGCASAQAREDAIKPADIARVVGRFYLVQTSGTPGQADYRFIYSDQAGHLHVEKMDDGALVTDGVAGAGSRPLVVRHRPLRRRQAKIVGGGRGGIQSTSPFPLDGNRPAARCHRLQAGQSRQRPAASHDSRKPALHPGGYNRNIGGDNTIWWSLVFSSISGVDGDPSRIIPSTAVNGRFNISLNRQTLATGRLLDVTGGLTAMANFPSLACSDVWRRARGLVTPRHSRR